MESTSKCWVIANFEIVAYVLTLIVSILLLLLGRLFGLMDFEKVGEVIGYSALIAALLSLPTKRGVFQYGRYVLLLLPGIGMFMGTGEAPVWVIILYWTVLVIVSIISGVIAAYAYDNIDEVVSRRMLYRNSNVSLFEFTWRYTLDRFCSIAVSILVCGIWLLVMIVVAFGGFTS